MELHPGIAGEFGYDTNYFQRAGEPLEPEIALYRFRVTPSLSLETLSARRRRGGPGAAPPKVTFRGGVSAGYNEFIAADSDFSEDVSNNRNVAIGADAALGILPEGVWGADLTADYSRTIDPSNNPEPQNSFDRSTVRAGAGVSFRPGGGLFEWRLGYQGTFTFFERDAFSEFSNTQHAINARGRWRFLPRTAMLYDGSVAFQSYNNDTTQRGSDPIRSRIGVNGLITSRFALLAMVGWGASFYDTQPGVPAQDYDSVIGQAQLTWYVMPKADFEPASASTGLSAVNLGYQRDFRNSFLANYYTLDRVYAGLDIFLSGLAVIKLSGGFSHLTHPQSFFADGTQRFGGFSDNRVDAEAFGEYRLSEQFGVNTTLRYSAALNENRVPLDPNNAAAVDDLSFTRFEAFIGARWFL